MLATAVYKFAFEKWDDHNVQHKPTELKDVMKVYDEDA